MAPVLGFALLLLIFSIGIFLPFFNFFVSRNKKISLIDLEKISRNLVALMLVSSVLTQLCLIYSFMISDYSVVNVYKNSHHLKPLIYKIAGSWGNHEGSMLLLITTLCAYTLAFAFLSKIRTQEKVIIISSISNHHAFRSFYRFYFQPIFTNFSYAK